ncbi:hypothetical protein ACFOYW_00575 [Gryllotalpicola reticulitermitis]|uniref:FXSXX-COOH protein n=1 Tax=Gryllotalpicola reticulitermitis TaxID=1184153 RepID=A0ABV8Q3C7_9MICO
MNAEPATPDNQDQLITPSAITLPPTRSLDFTHIIEAAGASRRRRAVHGASDADPLASSLTTA